MNKTIERIRHVLIVDNDPDYVLTLGDSFRILSENRWYLHTATNIEQVIETLKPGKIDILLLNLNLPASEVGHFLTELGQQHPHLKRVAMTTAGIDEKYAAILAEAADLCVEKILSPDGLRSVYTRLCGLLGESAEQGNVVRSVGPADLIQMECMAQNSSVLEFYLEQPFGRIYIENGLIIHASCGEIFGERAFLKLMGSTGGTYELLEFETPPERTLNRTWEYLLGEAARQREMVMLGSHPGQSVAAARPTAVGKTTNDEMFICSNTGEVLYNWQCDDAVSRVTLMRQVARGAELIIPEIQLGRIDRLELQLSGGRAIVQPRPDRMIFVRMGASA